MAGGQAGRVAGVPNRDKAELRALLQERVHEYTEMRHEEDVRVIEAKLIESGVPPAQAREEALRDAGVQQIIEDYDPVVALAITAVDRRTPLDIRVKCHADVAQYVRPKLKSVEVTTDPEAAETIEARRQLSEQLSMLLTLSAADKKGIVPNRSGPTPEGQA